MSAIRQKVIEALREMSREDFVPPRPEGGICDNAEKMAIDWKQPCGSFCDDVSLVHRILREVFMALKGHAVWPLGNWLDLPYAERDIWAGYQGEKRRRFAGECADWLEANP